MGHSYTVERIKRGTKVKPEGGRPDSKRGKAARDRTVALKKQRDLKRANS